MGNVKHNKVRISIVVIGVIVLVSYLSLILPSSLPSLHVIEKRIVDFSLHFAVAFLIFLLMLRGVYHKPYKLLIESLSPTDAPPYDIHAHLNRHLTWKFLRIPLTDSLKKLESLQRDKFLSSCATAIVTVLYYSNVLSLSSVRSLFRVAFFPLAWRFWEAGRIYKRAKIFIETTILTNVKDLTPYEARKKISEEYMKRVEQFESKVLIDPLECKTCFDIFADREELIDRYFAAQLETQSNKPPSFLCPIKFDVGYLAPTYLVSGPLSKYNEDWKKIINHYSIKKNNLENPNRTDPLWMHKDLRKLQSFIWDCWVQWGPSIPICNSIEWKNNNNPARIAVQFGYGDENNSLPLLYTGNDTFDSWKTVLQNNNAENIIRPVKVTGLLHCFRQSDRNKNFCVPQRDDAPLDKNAPINNTWKIFEASKIEAINAPLYYSAYVWVIIAIGKGDHKNKTFSLLHPLDKKSAPTLDERWRGLIPFFQHGNIAEASVYEDVKQELAVKTVDTLVRQLKKMKSETDTLGLQFAYVAAFDDNGDGASNLIEFPGKSILDMMKIELDERIKKGLERDIIQLKPTWSTEEKMTASDITKIIQAYLEQIDK